jgi:type IV pilus assembly protein PilC
MATQATASKGSSRAEAKAKVPLFIWEAKTKAGEIKKGEMEANDQSAVEARLTSLGLTPSKVRRKGLLDADLSFGGSVSGKDILIFTRQFSTMIDAGLPLVQCLDILASQTENPAFRKILFAIKQRVEGGSSFSDALKDHPKVFDELFVQLCAAGEVGGILDTILTRLAQYREKSEKLKRKVKGAMTYPLIVVCIAIAVTAVLLLKVTPVFAKMFADFGSALPGPTQVVVDLSEWLKKYIIHLVIGITAFIVTCIAIYRNPSGRKMVDKGILYVPMIGDLIRKVAVARFTRTLGTMISSGVPILDALDVTGKTAGNRTIEAAIGYVRAKIAEGKNISGPLAETRVFPSMVVQMIGVGEATGAMDQMLGKIADFYDDEVDAGVSALTSMIEPVMMVFLGGAVGGFLIAMYLPIFSIAGAIK